MKRNALLVGAFFLAGIAIVVAGVLWLGGRDLFGRRVEAGIYYRGNVSGLAVGAPVTFRGVTVGQVTDIGIEVERRTLQALISVVVRLESSAVHLTDGAGQPPELDVAELVKRGLRARLVLQSVVTSQKSVELDFRPDTPVVLYSRGGRPEIPALADRFDALVDQVADLPLRETVAEVRATLKELRGALASAQRTLDGTQDVLLRAGREVEAAGAASRRTLATADAALRQVQQGAAVTLDSVTKLADASRRTVADAAPELQRSLVGAREAAESARLAMGRVAELAAPGAPLRGDLDAALRDLSQAARSLRDWSEVLEHQPNAVVFGSRRE